MVLQTFFLWKCHKYNIKNKCFNQPWTFKHSKQIKKLYSLCTNRMCISFVQIHFTYNNGIHSECPRAFCVVPLAVFTTKYYCVYSVHSECSEYFVASQYTALEQIKFFFLLLSLGPLLLGWLQNPWHPLGVNSRAGTIGYSISLPPHIFYLSFVQISVPRLLSFFSFFSKAYEVVRAVSSRKYTDFIFFLTELNNYFLYNRNVTFDERVLGLWYADWKRSCN